MAGFAVSLNTVKFLLLLGQILLASHTHVALGADGLFNPDSTCSRSFIFQNKTYPVDSNRKQDGEGLRFVLKKNSQSEAMLNDYQGQLKSATLPAYIGTLGLAMAISGRFLAGTKNDPGRRDTTYALVYPGILLAVSSYIYAQLGIKSKESVLEDAVNNYNTTASEKEKIRVDLLPLPTGDGGEIKTQVPF